MLRIPFAALAAILLAAFIALPAAARVSNHDTLACVTRSLAANHLTVQAASRMRTGATYAIAFTPTDTIHRRFAAGDSIWQSCETLLAAPPEATKAPAAAPAATAATTNAAEQLRTALEAARRERDAAQAAARAAKDEIRSLKGEIDTLVRYLSVRYVTPVPARVEYARDYATPVLALLIVIAIGVSLIAAAAAWLLFYRSHRAPLPYRGQRTLGESSETGEALAEEPRIGAQALYYTNPARQLDSMEPHLVTATLAQSREEVRSGRPVTVFRGPIEGPRDCPYVDLATYDAATGRMKILTAHVARLLAEAAEGRAGSVADWFAERGWRFLRTDESNAHILAPEIRPRLVEPADRPIEPAL
ncbi:MAG: hypothetical protein KGI78_02560 [Patescibacteria group bacterium]|nr:hypothetical protein [Patescibacteria group bacterium]MDE1944039.1 hypothetical protein [Patescibacteria group bacterium]MDE1945198.1 hypothetical protein [Patescibacteria group bacterium]MDE2057714.1 hypothetical protein [Patescibacteria group bacterium]